MSLLHRYIRRLVVWLQTPSDEEVVARKAAAYQKSRDARSRLIRQGMQRMMTYPAFTGLRGQELDDLIDDVRRVGRELDALPEYVEEYVKVVRGTATEFAPRNYEALVGEGVRA